MYVEIVTYIQTVLKNFKYANLFSMNRHGEILGNVFGCIDNKQND